MGMELKDQVAVITGAASGFGEAIARRFAVLGAKVVVADINGDKAREVAASIGRSAIGVKVDVTSSQEIEAMIGQATAHFGVPDVVVNNAGYTHRTCSVLDVDEASFDRVFDVNVKSIFHMVRAVVPLMRDNGGGVMLNIGSTAGIRPRPGTTWYNASKGATNLASKALAIELAPWKIRVNAICPVIGATAMLEQFLGAPDTPENRKKFIDTIPMGRLSEPSDVAEAAVYLATADFITGVLLPVDGGRTI